MCHQTRNRYIKADKLLDFIADGMAALNLDKIGLFAIMHSIDQQPNIDAVEVVRCKDCHFWNSFEKNIFGECQCYIHGDYVGAEDFCSRGENRK